MRSQIYEGLAMHRKTHHLGQAVNLIGWNGGASFVDQSWCSEVKLIPQYTQLIEKVFKWTCCYTLRLDFS